MDTLDSQCKLFNVHVSRFLLCHWYSFLNYFVFRTRRGFRLTSRGWSLLVNSSRMAGLSQTTTFRRSPHFTWSWGSEVACRSSWRPSPARPSPLRLRLRTPLRMWRQRYRQVVHTWCSVLPYFWRVRSQLKNLSKSVPVIGFLLTFFTGDFFFQN